MFDTGSQAFTISASGAQTDYVYDDAGQLRFVTNALDQTTELQYDADGRRTVQMSPTGKTRQSVYDARGQLFRDILPDGEFTEFAYRADGSLHTRTMPDGSIETHTYGTTGLLLSVPWNTVAPATNYTYDGLARLIKTTVGVTETSWTYDLLDRQITQTEHIAGGPDRTISYTFEPDGMMASLTDGRSNTRQWTYTARGQLFRKTYPDTTFDEYTYRLDGSLNTRKTPAGAVETCNYNAGGLLTSRTWSDATPTVTYTYDAAARPLSTANPSSTVSWTYDALDRRITETQHLAGAAARTVGYAYDDDGNLAALGRPDGTEIAYAYDLRDQLTAVTADGPPPLAQYTYDVMGRRTNLLLENSQNTASSYDTAGGLLAHTHTIGGNPLDAVGYSLNANGWRTAIARPGGKDDTYTYDTTGQVIAATAASTAGPTTESFAYDLASNRTSSTASPPDGVQGDTPITYAANSLDQYTSLNGQAQTHDANGNTLLLRQPTQDDVTFEWDSENRMLVQERGGSDPARIVNHYDALHRRVKKEIYEKPGGTFVLVKTHTFIYDGWNVIEERQFNAGGTLTALTRLTWGADLSGSMQGAGGVGGLLMAEEIDLADVDPPTAHYYWYDGNGNVTGITDDTGSIEGTYRYTSFGALAETTTTTAFATAQPWKFSTKYHDTEVEPVAGTYYYGFRSYLPSVGRWPSRDPIGEEGGLNLYGMVGNDPVNLFDADGRFPGSPGHGDTISPVDSAALLNSAQKKADTEFDSILSKTKNPRRASLARNLYRFNSIRKQIGTNEGNKFVFTCKYGWIDHGHVLNNAFGTYLTKSRGFMATASWVNEVGQWFGDLIGVGSGSSWTLEDLQSNILGRQLGQDALDHDRPIINSLQNEPLRLTTTFAQTLNRRRPHIPVSGDRFYHIAAAWKRMLRDAGAVHWPDDRDTRGLVLAILEMDIQHYLSNPINIMSLEEARRFRETSKAWQCLCNGDRPRMNVLIYR